ncbi:MAG: DUF1883 domain-containing protein [Schleiferilactobacillus perolens]|uniref:DUF1883 domain-containing protein n=1 Tax=Schleiferilactobacillus perolens TaxID=100468 RepID=UPI0039E76117
MQVPYVDNPGGQVSVKVELHHSANVFLVDEMNYRLYQEGADFKYYGGHYDQTPVTISVSGPGRWYLIVDNGSGEQYQYQWLK